MDILWIFRDAKKFGTSFFLSLVAATILSYFLSQFTNITILKAGPAFVLIFVAVFVVYLFNASASNGIDKREIITILLMAAALFGSFWAIKHYLPEVFSLFPQPTKNLFSSFS